MKKVTVTEFARGLSDFINRATYRKEEFLITRGGKAVAALSPAPTGVRIRDLAKTLNDLPRLQPDDLSSLEADLEVARSSNNQPLTDPWESS